MNLLLTIFTFLGNNNASATGLSFIRFDDALILFLYFDAFRFEQLSQLLYFFLELTDELSVGVLVNDGLADDLLSTISISQCAECLIIVDIGRRYGGNHGGLRVTTQVFSQQPGKNRITIRNEICFL
uniref:Putative secreted protein n=1 Tax=Anopheles triannulatus TaxID=58253 RepID=A0A2M4B6H4_9DIPT